jgi:hypothetical protein
MQMRQQPLFLFMAGVLPLIGQESSPNDIASLMRAVDLSYRNQYPSAGERFLAYHAKHPEDSLASLRMFYNRLFETNHGSALSSREYDQFIDDVTVAIGTYEAPGNGCRAVDFVVVGHGLDCAYVGAALYSLRMALYARQWSFRKAGADRKRFLEYAARSSAPQRLFLKAMEEYQLSRRLWGERWMLNRKGIPTDYDHAVENLLQSLRGNDSPFVADILMTVLRIERESNGRNPCDPNRKVKDAAVRKLLAEYPPVRVLESLRYYADNVEVREFAAACGVSLR